MPDFALASQPNFAQSALAGYQAGAAQAKQNQLDSALQGIDLNRPETLLPVLRADPSTGAALIGSSVKLAAEKRDQESRAATAAYIKQVAGATATTAAPSQPTAPSPSAAPTNPDGSPADIVVTAPKPAVDPNAVRNAAIDADPQAFLAMQKQIGDMNKEQRDRLDDASQSFASIGQSALALPYEQRRGYILSHAGDLAAHGVPAAKIQSFDPTDQNLHTEIGQALGVKDQLAQANKAADQALERDRFAESQRHNRVDEGQGAARIGLEGANVGIARAHLGIAERADARAAAAAGTKATAGMPAAHYEYRIVNGVTQRRLVK